MSPAAERRCGPDDIGVVSGCAAVVDPERLGPPVLALVRLCYPNGRYKPFHDLLDTAPEIVAPPCHR